MAADTVIHRLLRQAEVRPTAPAYYAKEAGRYRASTWKQYVDEVKTAARALIALGVGRKQREGAPEDASCTCILAFNRPEWSTADLATMMAGGVPAGIYATCSPTEVAYIVGHTEAKVVFVENVEQWNKIEEKLDELPHLETVVTMKGTDAIDHDKVITWEAFNARAEETSEDVLQAHLDALDEGALATLIYTSGTTGPPKGVMLSHKNLAWTAKQAVDLIELAPGDRTLSYLPLSHIAEQVFTLHGPCTAGSQVYYAESIPKVADNLKEVKPTVLFAVPRIYEKFYAGVKEKLAQATGFKAKMVGWARDTGRDVNELRNHGGSPGGFLKLKYDFFAGRVYPTVKEALGLDEARVCVSGAAPISAEIIKFFAGLDLVIREVYGQSEDTGPTSFNVPGRTKFGSVGPAFPGVEVKIAEDDEILVKGPNVFMGYFKNPEATAETLVDGYLHSGDLGKFDDQGFLHITGRKKDLIITAGGKNIAPKNIESSLKDHLLVGEAVVVGDRRKYLIALISLDPEKAAAFAKEHGIEGDALPGHAKLTAELQGHVDVVNRDLARVEQIKKFRVLDKPFSIETGELTPTLKVKRSVVNKKFTEVIDDVYGESLEASSAAQ
ncbi:MAG: long-chain fatty acid--CoA ligase [Myxococcota bacterium]